MRHLNYTHLRYFHAIASQGSIAAASRSLHLTPQTLSGQLKLLEDQTGDPLFDRVGRRLVLTELGRMVYRYCDEIFALGAELSEVVAQGSSLAPERLEIGISPSVAKTIAHRLLAPALDVSPAPRIVVHEADFDTLVDDLLALRLDLVISDRRAPRGTRAFTHDLGACGISFLASNPPPARRGATAAQRLHGAPMLLPGSDFPLRIRLEDWFDAEAIVPKIVGEFDDGALLKMFGMQGLGVFPVPSTIEAEVCRMYQVRPVCRIDHVQEQFFALSTERRIKHPGVLAITEAARTHLFSRP